MRQGPGNHRKKSKNTHQKRLQVSLESKHIDKIVSISVSVPNDKPIIKKIGPNRCVITPVLENGKLVGHAIEVIDSIYSPSISRIKNSHKRVNIKKKAPYISHNVYDRMALPDGIYRCTGCGNYVRQSHKCK